MCANADYGDFIKKKKRVLAFVWKDQTTFVVLTITNPCVTWSLLAFIPHRNIPLKESSLSLLIYNTEMFGLVIWDLISVVGALSPP